MINVIMPVYKARDTLPMALSSLSHQTNRNFVVTFVQDCDGEDYSDIIDKFSHFFDIYCTQTPINQGPGMARQLGIDLAPQLNRDIDYVMFLDSDDMLVPSAIADLTDGIAQCKTQVDVLKSWINQMTGDGNSVVIKPPYNTTWCHGKLYRLEYLRENNIRFIPELRVNEDSYFNLLAQTFSYNVYELHKAVYLWGSNPNSLTRNNPNYYYDHLYEYFISQTFGIARMSNNPIACQRVGATWSNIYKSYQIMNAKLPEQKEKFDDLMTQVIASPSIMATLRVERNIREIIHTCQAGMERGEVVIFFGETFQQWLDKMGYNIVEMFNAQNHHN